MRLTSIVLCGRVIEIADQEEEEEFDFEEEVGGMCDYFGDGRDVPASVADRIERAVLAFPERVSNSVNTTAADHGFDSGEDDSDEIADEMEKASYKLRQAVALHCKPRACTRGAAKFAAPYAAKLLRERGFIVRRGDLFAVLDWLEAKPFDAPSEELWRYMAAVPS